MVGETVGKTDYVPLLDDDDETKAGSQDPKSKSHTDGGQVESSSAVGPAVVENGDHGIEDDSTVSPGEIMDEKMSCKEFLDRNETWSMDDRVLCFESQPMFRPMEEAVPFTMHREDVLSDLLLLPSEMETVPPFTEHFEASKEVHAPHSIVMVPEQPSLGFPYSPAEVIDPSPFITLDSTAESLMNIAATAGGTVPEENWLRAQDAVKGSETSFFVEPSAGPLFAAPGGSEVLEPHGASAAVPPFWLLCAFRAWQSTLKSKCAPSVKLPSQSIYNSDVLKIDREYMGRAGRGSKDGNPLQSANSGDQCRGEPSPASVKQLSHRHTCGPPGATRSPALNAETAEIRVAKIFFSLSYGSSHQGRPEPASSLAYQAQGDPGNKMKTDDIFNIPSERSPVAAAPTTVPCAVTEPRDETKATDMLQVEPTVSVPAVGDVSVPAVEELMTFEPSVQQHKSALAEPPTETSTPGADSPPVPENLEENKQSPSKPAEHLLKPNEQLPESSVPKEPLTVIETKETLPEKNVPAADLAIVKELKEEAELSHAHHTEPPQEKSPLKPTGGGSAKPEELKPVEPVTGSDITAAPNKELPPSPEKKAKKNVKPSASTPSAKPAAAKTKPLSTTSPKRPASATPGQNKKPTSPTAGPTSATTPKRPPTSTTRPSTLTPKDTKPKVTDAKSPEKRTSVSKPLSATTPRAAAKGSPTTPKTTTASPVTTAAGPRNTAASPPKRPTSIKTETKLADAKKTPMKSPSADLSRPKSAPASASKSSATTPTATTPGTPASPGVATSRPKPKPAAARPTTALRVTPEAKIPSTFKAPLKTSPVAKPPRPASSVSAPDLKNIRSKIGSTDNIKHQPGGGRAKVEKKPESAGAVRKSEPNAVSKMATTKTTITKEGAQKQPNGKVQIVSKK
uniref:Microtubule-associated protein n=1 Tax=Pelodiscus sinensis TaxID=13735 RepID=K7FWP3_PELSI